MKSDRRTPLTLALAATLLAGTPMAMGQRTTPARGPAKPAVNQPARGGGKLLTSAEECGRCHRDIYRYWKASLHAQSADDPRFQTAFAKLKEGSPRPELEQMRKGRVAQGTGDQNGQRVTRREGPCGQ